ncbi:MAG: acyl-CoA dehydrogenase family protein [Bdellovibrionota bacterium]
MGYRSQYQYLSQEQVALKSEAEKFAQQEIVPVAAKYDASAEFPQAIIKKAHALGLINLSIADELGGTGLGIHDSCLIIEEIAAGCGGFSTSMVANDLALTPILIGGTADQKKKFVQPIVEAGELASFCLSEPGAGSDAAGITTLISDQGDHYLLNGAKQWITNGGYAKQFTVLPQAIKLKNIKVFAVWRKAQADSGRLDRAP